MGEGFLKSVFSFPFPPPFFLTELGKTWHHFSYSCNMNLRKTFTGKLAGKEADSQFLCNTYESVSENG